jgi:hypothetical protein
MPVDESQPTQEMLDLCLCPVRWETIPGLESGCPDAVDLLHTEWLQTVDGRCVSTEDSSLVEDVIFDRESFEPPDGSTLINLKRHRSAMVADYMRGVGRLGSLNFMRPSDYGKHWTATGPRRRDPKVSYFYRDWRADTLASMFWDWFDDMFVMRGSKGRYQPITFLRETGALWETFRTGSRLRIAVNATAPVGEMGGIPLAHVAIDLDIAGGDVHAYPVTAEQAAVIMAPLEVRIVKCHEYD